MKNIFIAIILSVAATAATAHPLCDMKRTQREQVECMNMLQRGGLVRMQKNYERIFASKKVPQNEKDYINPNHQQWASDTEQNCGGDADCRYNAISSRNLEIEKYMKGYNITPI